MKKTAMLLLVAIISALAVNAQDANLNQQQIGQIYKHISQESQNTRDYVRTEMERQLEINHDDIQAQIEDNKIGLFQEINAFVRGWAIKLTIAWFSATLLALISYRLIMMRLTRRYRHAKMRDEIYGG